MLVGIVGPTLSGKSTVAACLIEQFNFEELFIDPSVECEHHFKSLEALVHFATSNWRNRYLVLNVNRYRNTDLLFKRPFFVLMYVDGPVSIRYARWPRKEDRMQSDLHRFIQMDEALLYIPYGKQVNNELDVGSNEKTSLYDFQRQAQMHIFNNTNSLSTLHQMIYDLDILNPEWIRPTWDTYFMALCELASKRSMKRRVGCIIVSECRVISTGYNGTPKGVKNCSEGGCARCNNNAHCGTSLDHCICMHAEENALLEAGRERLSHKKVTLYCNTCPCLGCAKKIIQVGIAEVVYAQDYGLDKYTSALFKEAGVQLRQVRHRSVAIN